MRVYVFQYANLSCFVKAAITGSLDITEGFLVLGGCSPGRVGSWRGQHHKEWTLWAPVLQEVERPVQLRKATGERVNQFKFKVI